MVSTSLLAVKEILTRLTQLESAASLIRVESLLRWSWAQPQGIQELLESLSAMKSLEK